VIIILVQLRRQRHGRIRRVVHVDLGSPVVEPLKQFRVQHRQDHHIAGEQLARRKQIGDPTLDLRTR